MFNNCYHRADQSFSNDDMHPVTHIHNNVKLQFDMRSTDCSEVFPSDNQVISSRNRTINEDQRFEQQFYKTSRYCNDRNGKPLDNGLGNQISQRQGYVINPSVVHGEPLGTGHVQHKDGQVQGLNTSGVEAISENLRLSGEPIGNTGSTGIPMMMDSTVVDNNLTRTKHHRRKRIRLSCKCRSHTYQELVEQNPIIEFDPQLKYVKVLVDISNYTPITNRMDEEADITLMRKWQNDKHMSEIEDKAIEIFEL